MPTGNSAKGYYRKKDGTPSGWLDHIHLVLDKHLADLYGRTPAADFGPKAFKAIRQRLVDAGNSRPYVNKLMPIITSVSSGEPAEELIPASVYHGLTAVEGLRKGRTTAREPAPILPVEEALVEATLPHLPPIVADMVKFQRLTGCRPGEVCQLRPMDLDRSGEVWQYRPAVAQDRAPRAASGSSSSAPRPRRSSCPICCGTPPPIASARPNRKQAMRDARQSAARPDPQVQPAGNRPQGQAARAGEGKLHQGQLRPCHPPRRR